MKTAKLIAAGCLLAYLLGSIPVLAQDRGITAGDFIKGNGKIAGGYRSFGLKEEGVGFAENQFNKANLADVRAKILQLRKDIIDGKIQVPDENTDMAAYAKGLM